MAKEYVTASEIGDFVFCRRGWWLKQNGLGVVTDAMTAGTAAHNSLFRTILMHKKRVILALSILILGIILAVISLIGGLQ